MALLLGPSRRLEHAVETARPEALQVQGDEREPGRPHGGDDLVPAGDDLVQRVGLDLQPRRVAVVAHAQLPEAQGAQRRLGGLDGTEPAERDRCAVGQPGSEAGGGRLVPGPQPQGARPVPDVVLGEAGVGQREGGPRRGGGGLPRTVVPQVAQVDPEDDGRALGGGEGPERGHEGRLAAGAAVGAVGDVGRVLHLVGGHADPAQVPLVGQRTALRLLAPGEGG